MLIKYREIFPQLSNHKLSLTNLPDWFSLAGREGLPPSNKLTSNIFLMLSENAKNIIRQFQDHYNLAFFKKDNYLSNER